MQDFSDEHLLRALDDTAEQRRAAAAVELARRSHPQALAACLKTLNDAPEPAHMQYTPAVWCLAAMGPSAVDPLLALMAGGPDLARLRAATAFMHISKRRFGFNGNRWSDGSYAVWSQWWSAIGYDHRADAGMRERAVRRLRETAQGWRN